MNPSTRIFPHVRKLGMKAFLQISDLCLSFFSDLALLLMCISHSLVHGCEPLSCFIQHLCQVFNITHCNVSALLLLSELLFHLWCQNLHLAELSLAPVALLSIATIFIFAALIDSIKNLRQWAICTINHCQEYTRIRYSKGWIFSYLDNRFKSPIPITFGASLVHLEYISKLKKGLNLFFNRLGILGEIQN